MEKKLRRDFKERQKIKEEAKLLGKEYMDADEVGKLKHGDDYRGKIIHEKDRFQDKIHEKESKRNSKNELLQGSPNKRKAKQPKIVLKDKETDSPMDKTQDKFVSDHQSVAFTSIANDKITVVSASSWGSQVCMYGDAVVINVGACEISPTEHSITTLPYGLLGVGISAILYFIMGFII